MNDVRDEAIGALLAREGTRIEAAPVDRLPEVFRRGSRMRAIRFTAITAAVAVFVGTVSWVGLQNEAHPTIPADISDWRTIGSLREDGWSVQVPPSWRIQETGPCQGRPHFQLRGAIVTSVDFEFRNRQGGPAGCGDAYVWEGFPRDGVAFAVQPYPAFGIVTRGPVTHFPLRPDALAQTGAVRGGPSESYVFVRIPGEFYPVASVQRWVGPEASLDDVAALDRLLGSLQVRGAARWTETTGMRTTLHDEERNYDVTYPADWIVADENLTPWLSSPSEILSLGTFPLRVSEHPDDGFRLFDAPVAPVALQDMRSDDVFISLQESGGGSVGASGNRSDHFGPLGCDESIYGCRPSDELPEAWRDAPFRAWWIPFEDAGRAFYLFVAIGIEATAEVRQQAWAVADSLSFEPAPS